jgi:hypothetical protein
MLAQTGYCRQQSITTTLFAGIALIWNLFQTLICSIEKSVLIAQQKG